MTTILCATLSAFFFALMNYSVHTCCRLPSATISSLIYLIYLCRYFKLYKQPFANGLNQGASLALCHQQQLTQLPSYLVGNTTINQQTQGHPSSPHCISSKRKDSANKQRRSEYNHKASLQTAKHRHDSSGEDKRYYRGAGRW